MPKSQELSGYRSPVKPQFPVTSFTSSGIRCIYELERDAANELAKGESTRFYNQLIRNIIEHFSIYYVVHQGGWTAFSNKAVSNICLRKTPVMPILPTSNLSKLYFNRISAGGLLITVLSVWPVTV